MCRYIIGFFIMNGFEQFLLLCILRQSWLILYTDSIYFVCIIITVISINSLLSNSDGQERDLCINYYKPTIIRKNFRYFLRKPMLIFAIMPKLISFRKHL